VVPWEPFWIPNIGQAVVCAGLLVYLMRTWNRPRLRVVEGISASMIVYTLLLVPWLTVTWCRLGRPLDAFAVPEAALVGVALLYRGPAWLGVGAMSLFAAENLFNYVYAHEVGLDELVPINGPTGTVGIFAVAVGIFLLRRRSRELVRKHVRCLAEIEALDRVGPVFAHAREELERQVDVVASEVRSGETSPTSRAVYRALDRLGALHHQLGDVVASHERGHPQHQQQHQHQKHFGRRLRAYEAQLGAMFLAAVGVAMNTMACLTLEWKLHVVPRVFLAKLVFDGAFVLYLAGTLRRPSSRRALWAVIACWLTALATVTYAETWVVGLHRPYTPFLGHKALMCILGLTLGSRFKLGVGLILATLAQAMALWFTLGLGAKVGVVPVAEPWVTLIYASVALLSLRMVAHAQSASIRLQHAEAEAAALRRGARLFLALRDRLNSPLQTLVLGADVDVFGRSARSSERAHDAIDRLVNLSRELAVIDVTIPPGSTSPSIDADNELRPRV